MVDGDVGTLFLPTGEWRRCLRGGEDVHVT